jgi:hypothetical protein
MPNFGHAKNAHVTKCTCVELNYARKDEQLKIHVNTATLSYITGQTDIISEQQHGSYMLPTDLSTQLTIPAI